MIGVGLTVFSVATFTSLSVKASSLWNILRPVSVFSAFAALIYLPAICASNDVDTIRVANSTLFVRNLRILSVIGFIVLVAIFQLAYSVQHIVDDTENAKKNMQVHVANIVLQACACLALGSLYLAAIVDKKTVI